MEDETVPLQVLYSERQALNAKRRLEEEARRKREIDQLVQAVASAVSKSEAHDTLPSQKELQEELARVKQELASYKASHEYITQNRPALDEMKRKHMSDNEQRDFYAQQFVASRLRKRNGARVPVAEVNAALEEFAGSKVDYGTYLHSKSLQKAGMPKSEPINGVRYYVGYEFVPEESIDLSGLAPPMISTSPRSPMSSPGSPSGFSPAPIYNSEVQMPMPGVSLKR